MALGSTAATTIISAPDSKAVPSLVTPSASLPKLPPTGSAGAFPSGQPINCTVALLK